MRSARRPAFGWARAAPGPWAPLLLGAAALLLSPLPSAWAGAGEAAKADETVTIVAKEFAFEPSRVKIELGQTVKIRLENEGVLAHNLTLEDAVKRTETIQRGKKDAFVFTAEEPGEYRFHCAVPGHREAGMSGVLVVARSGAN